MPAPDHSKVAAEYQRGLELALAGSFFEAHEAFEAAWRTCEQGERDFFQGLVHVVVSAYQRGRGRPVAAERQRLKALARLRPFTPRHRGLDVASLLAALDRAEPDLRQHLVQAVAEPGVTVEEEQQPERDEGRAGDALQDGVVTAHPPERAHRVRERDARQDEGGPEPE
jgi:predicted metal-dependent hydrolase